jgi:hypothetical protein
MHLAIIQHIKTQDKPSTLQLHADIERWEMQLKLDNYDNLSKAILSTVIFVATIIKDDKAVLLPQVSNSFLDVYSPDRENDSITIDLKDGLINYSSRWLLHHLIIHLQPYIAYKCVVKKLGTLIYPSNCDLLKCLTYALHDSSKSKEKIEPIASQTSDNTSALLLHAGGVLNDMLHNEIAKLTDQSHTLTDFKLEECIANIDPLLWEFICICTSSKKRATQCDKTKSVRRYALVSLMLITTNPNCNTLLHHLIADTVEVCGGSRQLIKILNRLGMCVSSDTHDRLVTCIAEQQQITEPFSELSPYTFTVASADNIDFLSSHAAVYCGKQQRSYHGTTIQLVQPVPSLTISSFPDEALPQDNDIPILQEINDNTLSKWHRSGSPSNSPHKLGKSGPKRKRTLTVNSSNVTEIRKLLSQADMRPCNIKAYQENLVLTSFLEFFSKVFAHFF